MALVPSRWGPSAPHQDRLGFPQLHDKLNVRAPRAAGVNAGVEFSGGCEIPVPQQLPYQLIGPWIGFEMEFCQQMTELVRGDFHSEIPEDGLRDRDGNRVLGPRP